MKQVLSKMRVANEELESVEGLIEARKEELVRLREPLDAEWLEIKEAKLLWEKGDEDLNRRSEHLRKVAIDLSVQEAEIEMTKTRISHESVQTLDNLQKTGELRQEAREILAKTRNEAQTMLIEAELRTKDAIHREMEVAARERDVRYALEIIERESERNANDRLAIIDGFEELIKAKKEIYG